jgi:hypothetical protein
VILLVGVPALAIAHLLWSASREIARARERLQERGALATPISPLKREPLTGATEIPLAYLQVSLYENPPLDSQPIGKRPSLDWFTQRVEEWEIVAPVTSEVDSAVAAGASLDIDQDDTQTALETLRADVFVAALSSRSTAAWEAAARSIRISDAVAADGFYGVEWHALALSRALRDVERLLVLTRPDPSQRDDLARLIERIEHREKLKQSIRRALEYTLAQYPADSAGLKTLDSDVAATRWECVQAKNERELEGLTRFASWPYPLRWIVLVEDRAQLATRVAEFVEAIDEGRLEEESWDLAGLDIARSPLTHFKIADLKERLRRWTDVEVRARELRMAFAVLACETFPEKPPLELKDPYGHGAPLHWRRTGPESGLIWSVGPHGRLTEADRDKDLVLEVHR